jgi:superfamily II DNA or RNA helicase
MSKSISIVSNAFTAKLLDADDEARLLVSDVLSYYELGYENTYSFKNGNWDGTNTMFHWETDRFPSGFLNAVNARLAKEGYEVRNLAKPLPAPLGTVPKTLGGFSYTDKYDYQWDGVVQLEKRGSMIARLATGAGKTFLAALCYTRIARPTLILTKRKPLFYQFEERLKEFGYHPGMVGDSKEDFDPNLTVAMSQTLSNRLDDPAVIEYLKTVEFIIGEEAHEISDDSYWQIVKRCPNAYYKLALTATPFMKDGSEANMKLLGAFGPVGLNVSEKLLIDRGVNATPKIKFMDYEAGGKVRFNSNYLKAVEFGITHNVARNNKIVEQAVLAKQRGLPVLTLIARQDHGKVLEALYQANGLKAKFIFGESNQKKRKQALQELARGEIDALIGSTILDVGVDVPMIGCLIIAGGGKAEVGYRQRIGRGLRSKPTGPNICMVVDFKDEHNVHLNDHFRERLKIIRETPGFSENLLGDNEPLPWNLFELC